MARSILLGLLVLLLAAAAIDAHRAPERQFGVPPAIAVIDLWQAVSVHFTDRLGCRFTPTCSLYGELAIRRYGAYRGAWLALKRIWSCSPWGGEGEDWLH